MAHFLAKNFPSVPVVGEIVPLNAGDVESALVYWADDATVKLVGVPPNVRDTYSTKEQVRGWFNDLVAQHFQVQIRVIKVQGNIVTTRTLTWDDTTRQLGIAPLAATEEYFVSQGKITSLTWTISPQSNIRLQAVLQKNREK